MAYKRCRQSHRNTHVRRGPESRRKHRLGFFVNRGYGLEVQSLTDAKIGAYLLRVPYRANRVTWKRQYRKIDRDEGMI